MHRLFIGRSIRSKLLSGYFLIVLLFIVFGLYLLFTISSIQKSFATLGESNRALNNFIDLEIENRKLGISVKDFILTGDKDAEQEYDAATLAFDKKIADLKEQERDNSQDLAAVKSVESNSDAIKGIELLVLARVREGDTQSAQSLFDSTYYTQESAITDTIETLVTRESVNVKQTLDESSIFLFSFIKVTGFALTLLISSVILISFLFSNALGGSIRLLAETARRIADGNLSLQASVVGNDEVGELALAFNDMTSKLKSINENLDAKVREKTTQLTEQLDELQRVNKLMVDRELKMVELKNEVEALKTQHGTTTT